MLYPVVVEDPNELRAEQIEWAMSLHEMPPKQFAKMRADAAELHRLRAIKWIRPPLKQFGPKKGIQPAYGFQRKDGTSPAPGQPVPARLDPRPDPKNSWEGLVPAQPAIVTSPKVISTSPQISAYEQGMRLQNQAVGSDRQERTVVNSPKPVSETDRAEEARILARFNGDAYGGELLPNGKIRYDNRDWTLQGWERERFKNAG